MRVTVSVLVLVGSVAAGLAGAGESADVRAGRDLYEQHCEFCHGADGRGDGPLADELKIAPADLTKISVRRGGTFPDAEVHEIIDGRRLVRAHGKSDMPIWGRQLGGRASATPAQQALVAKKIDRLVAFLRSIQVGGGENVGQR